MCVGVCASSRAAGVCRYKSTEPSGLRSNGFVSDASAVVLYSSFDANEQKLL